jgi:hypothetical protein
MSIYWERKKPGNFVGGLPKPTPDTTYAWCDACVKIEAFLDIHDRAEEADEALQARWPDLESVVNDEIMANLELVSGRIDFIRRIVTDAVGGPDHLTRLQFEREDKQ